MSIPKNLQEKRDEQARLCYINGEDSVWSTHNFKQGFDECAALLLPEIEKLKAAITHIKDSNVPSDHDWMIAYEALQSWQRFIEGGE